MESACRLGHMGVASSVATKAITEASSSALEAFHALEAAARDENASASFDGPPGQLISAVAAAAAAASVFAVWSADMASSKRGPIGAESPRGVDGESSDDVEEGGGRMRRLRYRDDAEGATVKLYNVLWARLHSRARGDDGKLSPSREGDEALRPWREVFAISSLMRCALAVARTLCGDREVVASAEASRALRFVDVALVIAGPEALVAPVLFDVAERLAVALADVPGHEESAAEHLPPAKRSRSEVDAARPLVRVRESLPPLRKHIQEIPRSQSLGLENFLLHHLACHTPVVARAACSTWPAVKRWDDAAFWQNSAVGQRFVPVEMDYWIDQGFEIMTIRNFVQHCFAAEGRVEPAPGLSGGGYIAQHLLLEQIPALAADVLTPDWALCGPEEYLSRHVFFGPKGTVTPLHFDPYENAFVQVVGAKYLRLYPPSVAPCLYARADGDVLSNNSTVEPADLLLGEAAGAYGGEAGRFPALLEAEFVEVVLEPGDLLFLPKGWWHYVKSLSTSISVAYHFN